eukprot:gene9857-biopygen8906
MLHPPLLHRAARQGGKRSRCRGGLLSEDAGSPAPAGDDPRTLSQKAAPACRTLLNYCPPPLAATVPQPQRFRHVDFAAPLAVRRADRHCALLIGGSARNLWVAELLGPVRLELERAVRAIHLMLLQFHSGYYRSLAPKANRRNSKSQQRSDICAEHFGNSRSPHGLNILPAPFRTRLLPCCRGDEGGPGACHAISRAANSYLRVQTSSECGWELPSALIGWEGGTVTESCVRFLVEAGHVHRVESVAERDPCPRRLARPPHAGVAIEQAPHRREGGVAEDPRPGLRLHVPEVEVDRGDPRRHRVEVPRLQLRRLADVPRHPARLPGELRARAHRPREL